MPPLPVNLYDVVKHWLWIKKPEINPWGKPVPPAIYTEGLLKGIESLVESLPDSEHLADFRTLAGRYDRHSLWVAEEMQVATLSRNRPSANPDKWRDIIDPAEHGIWRPYRIAKESIEWVEIVEPVQGYVRNVSPLEIWRTVFNHAQEVDTVKTVGADNPFKTILSITACEPDSITRACKTALRLFVQPEFNDEVRSLREGKERPAIEPKKVKVLPKKNLLEMAEWFRITRPTLKSWMKKDPSFVTKTGAMYEVSTAHPRYIQRCREDAEIEKRERLKRR